jgi:hypothetical protein
MSDYPSVQTPVFDDPRIYPYVWPRCYVCGSFLRDEYTDDGAPGAPRLRDASCKPSAAPGSSKPSDPPKAPAEPPKPSQV